MWKNSNHAKCPFRAGFTLTEMLLVLVILGFAMVITLPTLSSAMTGGRLRAAGRSVVMAGRHARCMSVLQQKQMHLEFDMEGGKLSVRSEDGNVEFTRELEQVKIVELQVGDETMQHQGKWGVLYENNGTCTPYQLKLADAKGREMSVEVDSLGSPKAEQE